MTKRNKLIPFNLYFFSTFIIVSVLLSYLMISNISYLKHKTIQDKLSTKANIAQIIFTNFENKLTSNLNKFKHSEKVIELIKNNKIDELKNIILEDIDVLIDIAFVCTKNGVKIIKSNGKQDLFNEIQKNYQKSTSSIFTIKIKNINYYIMKKSIKLIDTHLGKVVGTLCFAIVLNDNTLLIEDMKSNLNLDNLSLVSGYDIITTTNNLDTNLKKNILLMQDTKYTYIGNSITSKYKLVNNDRFSIVMTLPASEVSSTEKNIILLFLIIIFVILVVFIFLYLLLRKYINQEQKLLNDVLLSQNELKIIFDNAIVGLIYISKERILLKANQELANIFGYESSDDMLGMSMNKFHLSEERFIEYEKKNFESLKMGTHKHIEYQLRKKDGSAIWCEISGKAIDNNIPADLSKGVLWVIIDISERKEYQDKIEKQKKELETIFDNTHDGIAIINLEGDFLKCNKEFMKMTGYTMEEVLTKNCRLLTASEDREKNEKVIQKAIDTNSVEEIEKNCILKDGKVVTVSMSVSLLPDKERLILLVHDNTTLKLMQEQSKLAAMGEMIGNITHQWRQPLSVISTGATGLKIQKEYNILTDELFVETCDSINNNAQYLSRTIDDFKNFIKGDQSQVQFSISDNINEFLNLMSGPIKNSNINMILDIQEDIQMTGFPNELIQCIINIFNNSKDALKEKEIENKYIFISTCIINDTIEIKIKDNAGGIPNDVLPHIFEPYFTTKHQSQGTGLGLHMTYNLIVESMKGTIIANNITYLYEKHEYAGAEFKITLPLSD